MLYYWHFKFDFFTGLLDFRMGEGTHLFKHNIKKTLQTLGNQAYLSSLLF